MNTRHAAFALISAAGLGLAAAPSALGQAERVTPTPTPSQPTRQPAGDPARAQPGRDAARPSGTTVDQQTLDKATQGWDQKHLEQVRKMSEKYGMPSDAGPNLVMWKDAGPFAHITISREAVMHNFPMPHPDFLKHTIRYRIPADKVSDLIASDGSLQVDRTGGLLSAKCDTEAHTVLGLNLAHDILTGEKTVQEAREAHAQIAMAEKQGRSHPYLEKLQFEPQSEEARDPDRPASNPGTAPTATPRDTKPATGNPPPRK